MTNETKPLLGTVPDAATALGLSKQRIWMMIRNGLLPPGVVVRFGSRQVRIHLGKLEEWIESGGTSPSKSENTETN